MIYTTKIGNTLRIIRTEITTDFSKIVDKFGQGSLTPTGKCVDGFQVDFDVLLNNESYHHVVFQSLERTDNMRAYGSSEMTTAGKYGCDSDQSQNLLTLSGNDEDLIKILKEISEKHCEVFFDISDKN